MPLPDPLQLSVHQFMTDCEAEQMLEAMAYKPWDEDDDTPEQQRARYVTLDMIKMTNACTAGRVCGA